MMISILEGHVTSERWNDLEIAYSKGIRYIPPQLLENFLIQDRKDKELWRIITVWRSQEAFEEFIHSPLASTCIEIFRAVGVEPTYRNFNVIAHHTQV